MLEVGGVKASQIDTVSYGEEKPKATGHDEASWAQNRRTDLNYK
jgi:peptidoglycan-associated lipoprotein